MQTLHRINEINTSQEINHDNILTRLQTLEIRTSNLTVDIKSLENVIIEVINAIGLGPRIKDDNK
jgi:hypothetical protein